MVIDWKTGGGYHAVYARNYKRTSGIFCCVNSWSETAPYPTVDRKDVRYLYYVSIRQVTN